MVRKNTNKKKIKLQFLTMKSIGILIGKNLYQ